ncbi:MAG: PDZ domain-containing protein [Actinomycetota bacterium]
MDEALADLALYLNHGVRFARHRDLPADCEIGADLHQTVAGVEIGDMTDGGFCNRAGLRAGDVLLQLGEAPVFRVGDVQFFLRSHREGEEVDVTWGRDGEVQRGRGRLGARDELLFAHRV